MAARYNDRTVLELCEEAKGKLRMAAPRGPNDRPAVPAQDGGPEEAASYIAEQPASLAQLARRHGHGTLGLLLDMVLMEAQEIIRPPGK